MNAPPPPDSPPRPSHAPGSFATATAPLVVALLLAGCASSGDQSRSSDEAGINVVDPIDHFASNFDLDPESGRMVAVGDNRFDTGSTEAFNRSFRVEDFNRKAFDAARLGAKREFKVPDGGPGAPASDLLSQRSRMAGTTADEAAATADEAAAGAPGGSRRSRFEGSAADTPGRYGSGSERYDAGPNDPAARALTDAVASPSGPEASETGMSIDDVRRLLNKGS